MTIFFYRARAYMLPRKRETLAQRRFTVGPPSTTLTQQQTSVGPTSHVCSVYVCIIAIIHIVKQHDLPAAGPISL